METPDLNLDRALARTIGQALIVAYGQQTTASELLGISPRVLNYKLKYHGLYHLVAIGRSAKTDAAQAHHDLASFIAAWTPIVDSGRGRPCQESERRP